MLSQLTAYFGTDSTIRQIGTFLNFNGAISKRGNEHLRRIIFMVVFQVSKYQDRFQIFL